MARKQTQKTTPDLNAVAADALAEKIARDLFTTFDTTAQRLVIELHGGKLSGGYCMEAVRDVIAKHLKGDA